MKISGTYKTQHGDLVVVQNGYNISASYQESGVCSGELIGNKVEGIWKNKKDQGLFEWIFDDKGNFTGKYKSGVTAGPMRGKWEGKLITYSTDLKDSIGIDANNRILLEIYLRYDYPQEEIDSFDLELTNFSESCQKIDQVNFDYLEDYISKLHSDTEFISKLKNKLSEYEFYWDQTPQIWITKINDLNLKPLYDYQFNDIIDDEAVKSIMKISDDIEDWVSDYHSQTVFSIETLD